MIEERKATADPSTPFVAKSAPNSAQDDRLVEGVEFLRDDSAFFGRELVR